MAGNSLIEKSYKVLFIIYAPFAILTYLLKSFGDVKMSYISMFAIAASFISVVIGVYICVLYIFKHKALIKEQEKIRDTPFLLRLDFLIRYILITIVSFGLILSLALYNKLSISTLDEKQLTQSEVIEQKPRIALLFSIEGDITMNAEQKWDYGFWQFAGLTHLLRRNNDLLEKYNFSIIDHKGLYSQDIENSIIEEMKRGTKYFICTYSNVAVPLSQNFENLIQQANITGALPKLFITSAASPDVKTKKNSVYRFYVRSEEEGKMLAKKGLDLGYKTASFIAADDEYGKGAVEEFKKEWMRGGGTFTEGLFSDEILVKENLKILIKESIVREQDVVFIAAKERNLVHIIELLDEFNYDGKYLVTSTLISEGVTTQLGDILERRKWFSVAPFFKAYNALLEKDIDMAFVFVTIDKLIKAIEDSKNETMSFDEAWSRIDYPKILVFEDMGNGDFKVKVKIIEKISYSHPAN